jgi:predicted Zn-dependent protease
MKKAGFDQQGAVDFFSNLYVPPVWLEVSEYASTHPSNGKRIKDLEALIKEL